MTNGQDFLSRFLNDAIGDDAIASAYEERIKRDKFKEWQDNSDIDKKFINAKIGGLMSSETVKLLNRFIELYKAQRAPILLIMGQVGTGKTYAVSSVLNELVAGYYVDMTEFKLKVYSAQRYDSREGYEALMHRLARTKLLALDEVGRFRSAQEQEILFYLVNKRYANDLPMIISTNMDGQELAKYMGTAIYDRIKSKLVKVKLDGNSKRVNTFDNEVSYAEKNT